MNIRKTIDYSSMYTELDELMGQSLPQMELYREIGRLVCTRPEKGAAIMTSEYLQEKYTDVAGFSPRNVRRMREFFRTYESNETLMAEAMKIGWTQNVLIMERCAGDAERQWYILAVLRFGWSKLELATKIDNKTHLSMTLVPHAEVYESESRRTDEANIAGLSHRVVGAPPFELRSQVAEKPYPQPKTRGHPYRHRWGFSIMEPPSKADHVRSVNCWLNAIGASYILNFNKGEQRNEKELFYVRERTANHVVHLSSGCRT